ncbi:MAG: glycosyltransferase family 9 protein [Candidatus Omnitrophica bacterium]|nr:glycosyltransferase family 9 protein [Candidatus Omnitrophota bacterium]
MQPQKIKNILVVRNDRFGEFLLNIPALRALRDTFPEAKITGVVSREVAELAKGLSFFDEIIPWKPGENRFFTQLQWGRTFRLKHIDLAVMLNPSREFNFITFYAGIPIRVGYDRKCGFLLTHRMTDKKHLGEKHEVEYNLELLRLINAQTNDRSLEVRFGIHEEEAVVKEFALDDSRRCIALHPWTSDPVKQWPVESFVRLAQSCARDKGARVIVVGKEKESEVGKKRFQGLAENITDLTNKTTLRELAVLLGKCAVLISCDSGPVHLACAVKTPVVALFRDDIPGKSARRWGPWQNRSTVIARTPLSDISVEEVVRKTKELL